MPPPPLISLHKISHSHVQLLLLLLWAGWGFFGRVKGELGVFRGFFFFNKSGKMQIV